MDHTSLCKAAGIGLAITILPLSTAAVANQGNTAVPISERLLAAHNLEREKLKLTPLSWDDKLAADATAWANHLAQINRLEHATVSDDNLEGENLWMGTHNAFSPEQMVGAWISEKKYYVAGDFPNVSSTGSWADVGHFTQVAWKATTSLGCGKALTKRSEILVCRYREPGNIIGERPF